MISVSCVSARFGLLDGLRLPSSRLRPSPKPIATEGAPIAKMREQTTAALAEGRKDFMIDETRIAQRSCDDARFRPTSPGERTQRSPGCLLGLTDTGTPRSSAVRM